MFSLLFDHRTARTLVFLQYLFALAVIQAIKCIPGLSDFPIFIKWPNDIYVRSGKKLLKVGGILLTSSYERGVFRVVLGCGLNVTNPQPTLSLFHVAKELGLPVADLSRETVLAIILTQFDAMYRVFESEESFEPFLDLYHDSWLHGYYILEKPHIKVANK